MNRQVLIYGTLAVLMVLTAVWWFLNTYEYRTEEKDLGYSSEAMQKPYLAAERFLEKFGIKVKGVPSMLEMKKLPDIDDVLFIPTGRYDLSREKIQSLLAWVKKGGHLIVRARRITSGEKNTDDELFNMLGVETLRKKQEAKKASYEASIVDVKINSKIENKKVEFNTDSWLKNIGKTEPSWQVDGKNGSKVLEYHLGDGYISLLSDLRFMNNAHIGEHDHAAFLYTLVHMNDHTKGFWIVRNDDMPSLIGLVAKYAPSTILALVLLLLFWLWYTTRRFGPLLKPADITRRSLREHIIASGYFQWRNQNRTALLRNAKTALLEHIAQTRPPWSGLDQKELAARLAKIAGAPSDRVLAVLQAETVEKENEFTQYIETISLIRKKL